MAKSSLNRFLSYKKALRKRNIEKNLYSIQKEEDFMYDNLHQYSKNNFHTHRPRKTKNKGKRRFQKGNYSLYVNWKHSDKKNILQLEDQLLDMEV